MKKNNNKCEECYKNGKIPSDIDCAKCDEVIIDGCNVLEERKLLIHTDKYSIGEDGLIDGEIPFTDICYDLALQLQRAKAELEQYKKSKQASYEGMQKEWNYAINTLRDVEAANEKLKNRNKLYRKIIVENQQKYHNQIMVLKACIKGEINIDDFKNYAKIQQENKRLKKQLKGE